MEYVTFTKGDFKATLYLEDFFPNTMEKTHQALGLMLSSDGWNRSKTVELMDYFSERRIRAETAYAENSKNLEKILASGEKLKRKTPEYRQFMFCRDGVKDAMADNQREIKFFSKVYSLLKEAGGIEDEF